MCSCDHQRDEPGFKDRALAPVIARKEHHCIECGSAIEPGTPYYPFRYGPVDVFKEGNLRRSATTDHMCQGCHRAWKDLLNATDELRICLGQLFGCIDEWLEDGLLDETAVCVIWRERFPKVPPGSRRDVLETEDERRALVAQGVPTQQAPLTL